MIAGFSLLELLALKFISGCGIGIFTDAELFRQK
jgi:hypothetical protein